MTENPRDEVDHLVTTFLGKAARPELTEQIRSAHREEVLNRLASILDAAFKKAAQPRQKMQAQQRWFTICAYVAQTIARVVRDMEYEKLRAEMDELKEEFTARDVPTGRMELPLGTQEAKTTKT